MPTWPRRLWRKAHGIALPLALLMSASLPLPAEALAGGARPDPSCGPLCLTFCATWLGLAADSAQMARLAGTGRASGTSLAGLAKAAEESGMDGRCYRLRLADLQRITRATPAIAHVGANHFVVVWMDNPDEVTVVQPPSSVRHMSLRSFGLRWDGAALVVSRPGEQPRFGSLWRYVAGGVALAVLLATGASALLARARQGGKPRGLCPSG